MQPKSKIKAGAGLGCGLYKFFTSSMLQSKFINTYNYDKEALIFGTGGGASVHFCNEPFSTSTDCIVAYAKNDVNLKLIYYYLSNNICLLQNGFKGAGLEHVSKDYILNIKLNIPEQSLQKRYVENLDFISHSIEVLNITKNDLDNLVKSRFIEMFGDIIINNMKWPKYIISDISSSRLGKMLDTKQQTGNNMFPYLANFNVQWFQFEITKLNQMDFDEKDRAKFELNDGDLLVCEGGEVGRCAVWHNQVQPCYFQKALHRIRCNTALILPDYLAWWFKFHCDYNAFADIIGSKATIAHLPGVKLKKIEVTVPPVELQRKFALFIQRVDKSKLVVDKLLKKNELLKAALIQKYFG